MDDKAEIEAMRALAVATNSMRFNPDVDPDTADLYEKFLVNLRDELVVLDGWPEQLNAYKATGLAPEEVVALQASNQELKKEALPLLQAKVQGRLVVLPSVEVYDARLEEAGYLLNVLQHELHTDGLNLKVAERVAELAREEAEMPEPPRIGIAQGIGCTEKRKKGKPWKKRME